MPRPWILGIIIALGVLTAVGGGAALSAAATPAVQASQVHGPAPGDRHERRGQLLERVAAKLGISVEQLRQAFAEARSELGLHDRPGLRGRWREGEHRGDRPGPRPMGRPGVMGRQLEIAASAIGISPDQLRAELRGSSLEAVARAHGVAPETVANALLAGPRQHLQDAVARGAVSQEKADRVLDRLSHAIERFLSLQVPEQPIGPRPLPSRGRPD